MRHQKIVRKKKTVERETDEERHEILEICYVSSTFIYSIKLSTHTNYSDYNMAINSQLNC